MRGMTFPKLPRFSLRALLALIAILAIWLGLEMSKVRERSLVKQMVLSHHGMIDHEGDLLNGHDYHTGIGDHPERIPRLWSLLEIKPIHLIMIPIGEFSEAERRRIRNAYPELGDPCLGIEESGHPPIIIESRSAPSMLSPNSKASQNSATH
jgi:hypothetical protein